MGPSTARRDRRGGGGAEHRPGGGRGNIAPTATRSAASTMREALLSARRRTYELGNRTQTQRAGHAARERGRSFELQSICLQRVLHGQSPEPYLMQGGEIRCDGHIDFEAGFGQAHRRHALFDHDPVQPRIVGEADVQHVAPTGKQGRVEAFVHPPDENVRVQFLRVGIAERPLRAHLPIPKTIGSS